MNIIPNKNNLDALVGQFVKIHATGGHMFVKGTLCQSMVDTSMYSIYVDRQMAGVCFGIENVKAIMQGYEEIEIQLKPS